MIKEVEQKVAEMMREQSELPGTHSWDAIADITEQLARIFKEFDPTFDHEKFFTQAGYSFIFPLGF